jgi:two-component system response regulator PhoP
VRGRILVVDDNAESLKLYVKFLAAKGYEVDAAASALEADRAFERALPALVLVDVALPGEDGLSWVRRVKGHHESPPRFVAVTAYCTPDAKARALDAGCHAFAAKPTPLKDLLELVRAQMGASGGQDLQPGLV